MRGASSGDALWRSVTTEQEFFLPVHSQLVGFRAVASLNIVSPCSTNATMRFLNTEEKMEGTLRPDSTHVDIYKGIQDRERRYNAANGETDFNNLGEVVP